MSVDNKEIYEIDSVPVEDDSAESQLEFSKFLRSLAMKMGIRINFKIWCVCY